MHECHATLGRDGPVRDRAGRQVGRWVFWHAGMTLKVLKSTECLQDFLWVLFTAFLLVTFVFDQRALLHEFESSRTGAKTRFFV